MMSAVALVVRVILLIVAAGFNGRSAKRWRLRVGEWVAMVREGLRTSRIDSASR
jgi:hypothetical protein